MKKQLVLMDEKLAKASHVIILMPYDHILLAQVTGRLYTYMLLLIYIIAWTCTHMLENNSLYMHSVTKTESSYTEEL